MEYNEHDGTQVDYNAQIENREAQFGRLVRRGWWIEVADWLYKSGICPYCRNASSPYSVHSMGLIHHRLYMLITLCLILSFLSLTLFYHSSSWSVPDIQSLAI
jgi:hypothetical protein